MAIQHKSVVQRVGEPIYRRLCGWDWPAPGKEDDCEALTIDAREWLRQAPVQFPSLGMRMYVAWFPPLAATTATFAYIMLKRGVNDSIYCYLFGCAIGCSLLAYLCLPLRYFRRTLWLNEHGFYLQRNRFSTYVPWDCLLPFRDWNGVTHLRIPVRTSAANEILIVSETGSRPLSNGGAKSEVKLIGDAELLVFWTFRIDPRLFTFVAREMASEIQPSVVAPADGEVTDPTSAVALSGVRFPNKQTMQIPMSAVVFPHVCCRCGIPTNDVEKIRFALRYNWFVPSRYTGWLAVPVCADCWGICWLRYFLVMTLLEACWTLPICAFFQWELRIPVNSIGLVAILAFGLLPTLLILSLPNLIWKAAYIVQNHSTGEFRFRFVKPEYFGLILHEIQSRDHAP